MAPAWFHAGVAKRLIKQGGPLTPRQYSVSTLRHMLARRSFVYIDAETLGTMCLQGTDRVRFGLARLKVYLAAPAHDFKSTLDAIKKFVVLAILRRVRLVAMQELLRHLCEGVMRHPKATPEALRDCMATLRRP